MDKYIGIKNINELHNKYPLELIENKNYSLKYNIEEKSFIEEKAEGRLSNVLRISHIGDTSIIDMLAIPVIDILFEVSKDVNIDNIINELENLGYTFIEYNTDSEFKVIGIKGYGEDEIVGDIYHLQFRYLKKWDEHYFRDHLNRNSDAREYYKELKSNKYMNIEEYYIEKEKFFSESVAKEKEEYQKYIDELNFGRVRE